MQATVVYYDAINDVELIECNGHRIQFGGQGGGYCFGHQSFDCLTNLSLEEITAFYNAYVPEKKV